MGIKSWFSNFFGKKVIIKDDPNDIKDNVVRMLFDRQANEFLGRLHSYSTGRQAELADYEEMLKDGITLSAVNLLAEDASVIDEDTRLCAWVECVEDNEFASKMTEFLRDKVRVNDIVFTLAYSIVAYGEAFLSTNFSNDDYKLNFELGDYFELADVSKVIHIYKYGAPVGYLHDKSQDIEEVLPEKSYIHFISDRGSREYIDEEKGVYIKFGTSFLEAARYYYKQRQLLDDLLILARLTRSSFYRLFQVEVGNSTSQDTSKIMEEVRRAVTSKQSVDVNSNVFSSRCSPILTGGNVYSPVRNGMGAIDVKDVGGEVNVSALADIDYFDDRFYGALNIPKQFLGQADETPGGLGDTSLTQLDIRYARTVRRVQRIIGEGLRNLVIWKCLVDGREDIPEFKIVQTHILTAEDEKRSDRIKSDLDRIKDFLDVINTIDPEAQDHYDKEALVSFIASKIYKDPSLIDMIYPTKSDTTDESPEESVEPEEDSADDLQEDSEESEELEDNEEVPELPSINSGGTPVENPPGW